jgi:hypothetical protein
VIAHPVIGVAFEVLSPEIAEFSPYSTDRRMKLSQMLGSFEPFGGCEPCELSDAVGEFRRQLG